VSFLRNYWYVAAWSHEVAQDALMARTILGESVLLYRATDGSIVALSNRCCHRHAPLSMGRKEGDCVRCMYHGLKYDRSGKCVEIPGQSSTPDAVRVKAYPVVERTRWIWLWMGDPSKADATLIPETLALDSPKWRMKPGYLHYQAAQALITDNVLDFSHLSYVHEKTLGGATAIAEARPKVEAFANGVKVTRVVKNSPPAPYHRKFTNISENVDRTWIYDYLVPGILRLETIATPVSTSDDASTSVNLMSCQAITPETESTSHYFFMQAHGFALDEPAIADAITETIFQSVVAAFEEDKRIVEGQQKLISASPGHSMIGLPFDLALTQYRRIVERLLAQEAAEASLGN
jgi:phenylpropionate dioxygenase-like ring-hydroxylating dioxygenase large terminal subunit